MTVTVDSNLFYYLITQQKEWKNENKFLAKDVKKGQSNNLNVNIIIAYHLKRLNNVRLWLALSSDK